jgi:hypothetical protein
MKFFNNKKKDKPEKKDKLNFSDLYRKLTTQNSGRWIKSERIGHANPSEGHVEFKRTVRIKYNDKWHKGKFKPWKDWYTESKDFDSKFIVKTKSGRKMLIPKEKVYFKQYFGGRVDFDCDDNQKIHLYIKGEIKNYEDAYKEIGEK